MIKFEELKNVTTNAVEDLDQLLSEVSHHPNPLTYAGLLDFIKDPAVTLLVVKDRTKIIGMGTLITFHTINGKRGNLEHIIVDEGYRGQGLGEKLCVGLIEIAQKQHVKQLELTSNPDRIAARKLYQKLGFEPRETGVFRLKL